MAQAGTEGDEIHCVAVPCQRNKYKNFFNIIKPNYWFSNPLLITDSLSQRRGFWVHVLASLFEGVEGSPEVCRLWHLQWTQLFWNKGDEIVLPRAISDLLISFSECPDGPLCGHLRDTHALKKGLFSVFGVGSLLIGSQVSLQFPGDPMQVFAFPSGCLNFR